MALESLREPASWVIRHRETGAVVMEFFDERLKEIVNTKLYEVVPILEHLQSINRRQRAAKTPE